MNITAKELSGMHIGGKFLITNITSFGGWRTVLKVDQRKESVEIVCENRRGGTVTVELPHNTPITIQEGK